MKVAYYNGIPVQIVAEFERGEIKMARIYSPRQPIFWDWTHGGYAPSWSGLVFYEALRDVEELPLIESVEYLHTSLHLQNAAAIDEAEHTASRREEADYVRSAGHPA